GLVPSARATGNWLLDEPRTNSDSHGLRTRPRPELRQDPLRVRPHRLRRQPELLRDLLRVHAVGQHLKDLALARGQRALALLEEERRGQRGVHVELAAARRLYRADEVLRR